MPLGMRVERRVFKTEGLNDRSSRYPRIGRDSDDW